MNPGKPLQYILVNGFGWSGSSALVDLLSEFDSVNKPGTEFRALKDPYGVTDLYHSIIENGNPERVDIAIRDFLWMMEHLDIPSKRFRSGLNYRYKYGPHFMEAVHTYVERITSFRFDDYWWFYNFKKTRWELFKERKLHMKEVPEKAYFSDVSEEAFLLATTKFIDDIFEPISADGGGYTLLDNALSENYPLELRFFDNSDKKVILVDRDPRDIYCDLMKTNYSFGREIAKNRDVNLYIRWHKAMRRHLPETLQREDVKLIHFEDLVLHYEETLQDIVTYLGLDIHDHTRKKECFDPSVSAQNVGMWKEILTDSERKMLEKHLGKEFVQ